MGQRRDSCSVEALLYLAFDEGKLKALKPIGTDERILEGRVIIGHEVRSFHPCTGKTNYWLSGDSPARGERPQWRVKNLQDRPVFSQGSINHDGQLATLLIICPLKLQIIRLKNPGAPNVENPPYIPPFGGCPLGDTPVYSKAERVNSKTSHSESPGSPRRRS